MDAVVPLPSARLLALIGVLSAPLLVLVCLTHDAAAHQAALTGVALIATVVAADGCRRARNPAQYALFAGIALWTAGSAIATLELFSGAYTSYPTVAEAFWLASYPAFWVALMLMVPRWGLGHWIDGIVACLGTAAVASAILMPGLAVSGLSALGQGVASAFAIGDFLLLGFTGAALIVTRRWRVAAMAPADRRDHPARGHRPAVRLTPRRRRHRLREPDRLRLGARPRPPWPSCARRSRAASPPPPAGRSAPPCARSPRCA